MSFTKIKKRRERGERVINSYDEDQKNNKKKKIKREEIKRKRRDHCKKMERLNEKRWLREMKENLREK